MRAAAGDLVARAHARLLADSSLQFDFPTFETPKEPDWLKALFGWLQAHGHVLEVGFWIIAALGLLFAAIQIIQAVAGYRRRYAPYRIHGPNLGADPASLRPARQEVLALLEEADRLAARSCFAEAAHVLLFRTLADLQQRRPRTLRPALTSRDIAGLEEIPTPARRAFAVIADRVECSFFGDKVLDAGDFRTCRDAYLDFAKPESWGAPA